jgi:GTP-binding protein HflX
VVNETLKELKAFDKPTILVFNKMDAYEQKHFDEHLPLEIKNEIREDLNRGWQQRTNNKEVFISAVQKENIDVLRYMMYDEIRRLYQIRYPYKTEFF